MALKSQTPMAAFAPSKFGIFDPAIKFVVAFGDHAKELVRRAESGESLTKNVIGERKRGDIQVVYIGSTEDDPEAVCTGDCAYCGYIRYCTASSL